MDETSLEDFLDGADENTGGDDSDSETEGTDAIYEWRPDGDDCAVCGTTVRRRWRDGDRLVCADCKAW
jgi:hypothetical protein